MSVATWNNAELIRESSSLHEKYAYDTITALVR